MNRIHLVEHMKVEELEGRYRQAKDGVGRSQWQMLWLMGQGQTSEQVAAVTGYSVEWVRAIARRYNEGGPKAIGDGRHRNRGQPLKLNREQQVRLKGILQEAVARGDSWTGKQVADWMSEELGQSVHRQRGWEMLYRLGFTSKTPRPRHAKADEAEQQAFKKTSSRS